MTIRLPRSPSDATVRLIGQPERWAFMRRPKTNRDLQSVELAYDRLQNAISTARMCRVRNGGRYGYARVRNEPVPGRLRRPYGVRAEPHALPPLHRGGAG